MTQRDWQKDMALIIREEERWEVLGSVPNELHIASHWLQEAEKWRKEAFRKYPTPEAYEAACTALEKHRGRADAAEAREQQLKAFVEKLREENSAHDFYYGGIHEECNDILSTLYPDTPAPTPEIKQQFAARPLDEWHEEMGDMLWWMFPIQEPPYCGNPLDSDWSDCYTHWTPIVIPTAPAPKEGE
ncbi:hypothetical protein NST58_06535 [Paenibacillus sp. FSL R10-2796]|uniref:hypothetical protein n=1 Tax=Paenibacillus sp. FSL R10-2796 TaxID=2954663 RepID=UPI0030DC10CE